MTISNNAITIDHSIDSVLAQAPELETLANDAFAPRSLVPNYFDLLKTSQEFNYMVSVQDNEEEANLKGFGLVTKKQYESNELSFSVAYLDKLAVSQKYQSNGVGQEIMSAILEQTSTSNNEESTPLVLRTSVEHNQSNYYKKIATKLEKQGITHQEIVTTTHVYHVFNATTTQYTALQKDISQIDQQPTIH